MEGEACASCGCTSVLVTVTWSEPVRDFDGQLVALGELTDCRCKECGLPVDVSALDLDLKVRREDGTQTV